MVSLLLFLTAVWLVLNCPCVCHARSWLDQAVRRFIWRLLFGNPNTIRFNPQSDFFPVDGRSPFHTTLKPWETMFVGIYRGIIRWCEADFATIHSIRPADMHRGAGSRSPPAQRWTSSILTDSNPSRVKAGHPKPMRKNLQGGLPIYSRLLSAVTNFWWCSGKPISPLKC